MIWKIVLVAMQAAGIMGVINLTPEQKQSLHAIVPVVCGQYGAEGQAAAVESGVLRFVDCLGELYDYENVTKEVPEAMENGTLDSVMAKYCEKAPQVKKCLLEGLESVMPCAPPMLQVDRSVQLNATDTLMQGACGDKGDRLALFIAEKGKECIVRSIQSIRDCSKDLKSSILKNLDMKTKCTNYEDMASCVVATVLFCETNVTALIMNSIFGYIRDISPCRDYIKPIGGLRRKQK